MTFMEFYSSKWGIFAGCTAIYFVVCLAGYLAFRRHIRFQETYRAFLLEVFGIMMAMHGIDETEVVRIAMNLCGIDDETPEEMMAEAKAWAEKREARHDRL